MTCDDWKAFLQDHVSGALSDGARAAVDRHLSDCGGCFGEARLLKRIDEGLRSRPEMAAPAGLVDRVVARTHPEIRISFRRELIRLAAAVLVVGVGALFFPVDEVRPLADATKALYDAAAGQVGRFLSF